MAGYGWNYLTVTYALPPAAVSPFTAGGGLLPATEEPVVKGAYKCSDESEFDTEKEMLGELGVTGWELVSIRESGGVLKYYFKRLRT